MLGFGLAFGCFGLWLRAVESFACLLGPGRQDTPKERTSTTDRRLMNLHRYYRLSWVLQEDSFLSPRPSRRKPMKYVTEVRCANGRASANTDEQIIIEWRVPYELYLSR